MGIKRQDVLPMLKKQLRRHPHRKPSRPLVPEEFIPSASSEPRITWFGHSAFLLQMNDMNILLDPMLSQRASPFQWIGPRRFAGTLPVTVDDLPPIDVVMLSHDHYDHLDYHSIKSLADKVSRFFVPIGLAAHLTRWGVPADRITEMDWWEESQLDEIRVACTPSRHFSGRTLTDRDATLWCSWAIRSQNTTLFFSGDGGYGPHFAEIGEKYGPFDLTLLECGQYDESWPFVHMTPEQTVQAAIDLRSRRMMPIHWGTFTLAFHTWTDPIERVLAAGAQKDITIMTPKIGESVSFKSPILPTEQWWESADSRSS